MWKTRGTLTRRKDLLSSGVIFKGFFGIMKSMSVGEQPPSTLENSKTPLEVPVGRQRELGGFDENGDSLELISKRAATAATLKNELEAAGPILSQKDARLANLAEAWGYPSDVNPVKGGKEDRQAFRKILELKKDIENRLNTPDEVAEEIVEEKEESEIVVPAGIPINKAWEGKGDRSEEPKNPEAPKKSFFEKGQERLAKTQAHNEEVLRKVGVTVTPKKEVAPQPPVPKPEVVKPASEAKKEEISEADKKQIDEYAKYAVYGNPPTSAEAKAFAQKFEKQIAARAETLGAKKEERWNKLPEEQKIDIVTRLAEEKSARMLPWEKKFLESQQKDVPQRTEVVKKAPEIIELETEVVEDDTQPETPEQKRVIDWERVKKVAKAHYFEDAVSKEDEEFYKAHKGEVHRAMNWIGNKEEKFGDAIEAAGEKIGAREDKMEATIREKLKDPTVLAMVEKMNLDLRYVYNTAPDFLDLDPNQQRYILEKIGQKVAFDADMQSKENVKVRLARKTKFLSADWFKKKKEKWFVENEEKKEKRALIADEKEKGLREYTGDIAAFTNHMKLLATPITYDEKGGLRIEYVHPGTLPDGMDYEQRFKRGETMGDYVRRFNASATALSEMPDEWRLSKLSLNKKRYNDAEKRYTMHKNILFGAILEKYGETMPPAEAEAAAMSWMNDMDTMIHMNQTLTAGRESLEKAETDGFTTNFKDWDPAMTKWGLGKIGFVAGALARKYTREASGLEGSLMFGGALGGFLAGRREWLNYSDKEKKKRYGAAGIEDKGIKHFLDAPQQIDKLQFLIDRFDTEEDEATKAGLGQMLRNRVAALSERIREGRVNYGGKDEFLPNKLRLIQLISEANTKAFAVGAFADVAESKEFYERLNKIQKDRKAAVAKATGIAWSSLKGAAKGAGGALAGWFIADKIMEHGSPDSYVPGRTNEIRLYNGDGPQNDVAPGFQPTVAPEHVYPLTDTTHIETPASPVDMGGDAPPSAPVESAAPSTPDVSEHVQSTADVAAESIAAKITKTFADSAADLKAEGFAHTKDNFGDIFSKQVPMNEAPAIEHAANVADAHELADTQPTRMDSIKLRVESAPLEHDGPLSYESTPEVTPAVSVEDHLPHGEIHGRYVTELVSDDKARVLSFNAPEIRGQVQFLYDPETGQAVQMLQAQNGLSVSGHVNWQRYMEDNWRNNIGDRLPGKVEADAKLYMTMKAVLKQGGFEQDSPEYAYLNTMMKKIVERSGAFIKEESI